MKVDDIHKALVGHYKNAKNAKTHKSFHIQSIVGQQLKRKSVQVQQMSPYEDFRRNQKQVAAQSQPLYFRQLPRKLKVYFPGPPAPPPQLQQTPYTYQIVPNVPFHMPKQDPGYVGDWIIPQCRFIDKPVIQKEKKNRSLILKPKAKQQDRKPVIKTNDVLPKTRRLSKFQQGKQKYFSILNQKYRSKSNLRKNHNFYNSAQFFLLCRSGDKTVEDLLRLNSQLAFDIDEQQMTGLHWAARGGHVSICRLLARDFKSSCNAQDKYGRTPLHLAVENKHIQCIIRLFIQGSHTNIKNKNNKSVKQVASDAYIKYLLQRLEQIKYVIQNKGQSNAQQIKTHLQIAIRQSLDQSSLYF